MKIDTKKIYLDLLIKILLIAALGVIALVSCGKIGERWDEQDAAETAFIENYKAELKAEQTKD